MCTSGVTAVEDGSGLEAWEGSPGLMGGVGLLEVDTQAVGKMIIKVKMIRDIFFIVEIPRY